jgi:hypothetical protein
MTSPEHDSGEMLRPFSFEDIVWKGPVGLRDQELLQRNLATMRLLITEGGTPTKLIDNDYAVNVPQTYDFGGTEVEFLPHWGFYTVGSLTLGVPETAEHLAADLEVARYVASRQPQ